MFYVCFIDGQTASKAIDLNSGRVGTRLKYSHFQTRCSQRKTVAAISPLLEMTAFHGNQITSIIPNRAIGS